MNYSSSDFLPRYAFVDAVRRGDSKEVERLLDSGLCSIHERDQFRRTGVHIAVMNNDLVTCAILLSRGAYKNPRDDEWQTPMHYWALHRDRNMLRLLKMYGAATVAFRDNGVTTTSCATDMNKFFGDIAVRRRRYYLEIEQEAREYLKLKGREQQSSLTDFEQAEAHKQKRSRGGI
jgi:ankyrin repeat protein